MKEVDEILAELESLVGESLKSVSYKWVARHFEIHVNLAKQILFSFAEQHRKRLSTTYLIAGWTKDDKKHVFQLVDGKTLQNVQPLLDPVTSLHVYSVQPSIPKDAAEIWNFEKEQTRELYEELLAKQMSQNCLSDNKISAVYCPNLKRDCDLKGKLPTPVADNPAPQKTVGRVAAKIDGIMAGATAEKKGVASASVAVPSEGAGKRREALTKGPASAPPAAPAKLKQARPPAASGKAKGAAALSKMWGNAQPKKQAVKSAAAHMKPAATDAEEAIQTAAAEEQSSDDDDSEEEAAVLQKRGAAYIEKGDSHPSKRAKAALETSDDEDAGDGEETASGEASKDDAAAEPSEVEEPKKSKREPQKSGTGKIKIGSKSGAERRKVAVTTINDKGEEVTEETWETDTEDNEPELAAWGGRDEKSDGGADGSVKSSAAPKVEAKKSTAAKTAAKKPSPAKGGKKSAKGKSGAGQKSLTSFFKKK